ncbi:fumarylacetoacetate hydrolase family protein [Bradyrhizobium manausense]|uniref:fumarylacetoacetate hydrolase family protein n=1 Tax=Bradyrhizobium manausense TaxID=989370 RepID=UPI001BADA81C|nr:fumarylacetoacetate hydrolase family protein [Bradyrhizobium manausense]MBR0725499.1 fumarylacetoacetate hydrolase family protein [Bradyrhizobium manausense]MBR0834183.1 fumarylacetoacetate hydrolase family protein [Bradyrhizobium manausense]
MRFATVNLNGKDRVGVVQDGEIALIGQHTGDMVDLISASPDVRSAAIRGALNGGERIAYASGLLAAPIRRFRRDVLCTGWNYWDHFEEGRGKREGQEVDRPKAPTFFTKSPDVVIGPEAPIAYNARISAKWDYEAELAIVIGKTGRSIPRAEAFSYVFGYCLANDVSQRDLQRRHGGQWFKGKSIDGTMPLGPVIVTPDELDVPNIRLQCELNGQVLQDAVVAQMAFPIDELIAELSFGMTLHPGDVILTGTPSGVGNAREPQIFMKEGDEVVVRGTGIGELRNRLVATDLAARSDVLIG